MTNYNDGNWHGWNGGAECPVHPKTKIEGVEPRSINWMCDAEDVHWSSFRGAFRVAEEHKELREWYGWMGASGRCEFFDAEEKRDEHVAKYGREVTCFKVREVTE